MLENQDNENIDISTNKIVQIWKQKAEARIRIRNLPIKDEYSIEDPRDIFIRQHQKHQASENQDTTDDPHQQSDISNDRTDQADDSSNNPESNSDTSKNDNSSSDSNNNDQNQHSSNNDDGQNTKIDPHSTDDQKIPINENGDNNTKIEKPKTWNEIINILLACVAGSCILIICCHACRRFFQQNQGPQTTRLLGDNEVKSMDYTYAYASDCYDFDKYQSDHDNVSRGFNYNQSICGCSEQSMAHYKRYKKRNKGHSLIDAYQDQSGRKKIVKLRKWFPNSTSIKDKNKPIFINQPTKVGNEPNTQ